MTKKEQVRLLNFVWKNMLQRCNNPKNPQYHRYGGRGITVCKEWRHFSNFYSDMGFTYQKGLSIERIDNDKGYSYENCRWATIKEQNNNRSTNVLVEINGQKKNITEWCEELGLNKQLVYGRISLGWTPKKAITTRFKKLDWSNNLKPFWRRNAQHISYATFRYRVLVKGMSLEEAAKTPKGLSTHPIRTACKI